MKFTIEELYETKGKTIKEAKVVHLYHGEYLLIRFTDDTAILISCEW